ncbi:hypothetical protein FHR92_005381 [Fontibacillus solani]|uniref:Uncharacterized protein n=1 Tax=Fontibacillus solani TaxID=1572857 RepID=A0A7W3XUP3_9BACL|nr:hypothetical protein [Fontibacillus solani]MBA9088836.1 hypothetical protein [Fontibacillus solani]
MNPMTREKALQYAKYRLPYSTEVGKIYAIEPEFEMRKISHDLIGERRDIVYIGGVAENTKLLDQSIDLIVAANAYL